jgi:nucleotide-binding universal stress UspA family protein
MLRIAVALDGSKLAEQALAHATFFAKSFEVELHVLHVMERKDDDLDMPFDGLDWELRAAQSKSYLLRLQNSLAQQQITAHCHAVEGNPPTEIIEFCRKNAIDLLVLSAYGVGGVTQFQKGSTVQKVISRADLSILLVRPEDAPLPEKMQYRKILVLVDGSWRSEWAACLATHIAGVDNAELSLLQVIQQPKISPRILRTAEGKTVVERLMELCRLDALKHMEELKMQLPRDLKVTSRVLIGTEIQPLVEEIADADAADLVVLSAHGDSECPGWPFGPVAEIIVGHSSRPVLVFQDALERNFNLKPISPTPLRGAKVERLQHRAEAS